MREESKAEDPLVGATVDRYRIRRRIGAGGMGAVYEANHVGLDKRVAVKFLLDKYTEDQEAIERFQREARTASQIGHENIVDITDIGQGADGRSFIAMEMLEGVDLGELARATGPMPPARALPIIEQVLRGLAAAHAKGIVHRDMKPENVFVTTRGDRTDFVKIMDFGISKVIAAHDSKVRLTKTGAVVGTPVYMAPEQAQADPKLDHRVDLYAVGVMLYELLAGRPPFTATSYLALVTQHLHEPPPPLQSLRPDLPAPLCAAVHRALEKNPAGRYASAEEFLQALPPATAFEPGAWDALSTLSGEPVSGPRLRENAVAAPTAMPPSSPRRRALAPYVMVALAAAAAIAMIAWALSTRTSGGAASEGDDEDAPVEDVAATAGDPAPEPIIEAGEPVKVAPLAAVLEIESRPAGAKVYVDGELVGETPVTVEDLEIGIHQLSLEMDGYKTLEAEKEVRAGYRETFFAALAETGSRRIGRSTSGGTRRTEVTPREGTTATKRDETTTKRDETTTKRDETTTKKDGSGSKPSPYGSKSSPYDR